MRTRTQCILTLTALLVLGTTSAQAQQAPRDNTIAVRIYELEYCPANQLFNILQNVMDSPNVRFVVDDRSNRLLVTASPQQFEQITAIIQQLDVPTERETETRQMLYRVYMLEPSVKGRGLQAFSLTLVNPTPWGASELIDAIDRAALQVSSIAQEAGSEVSELRIEGCAPSKEAVKAFVDEYGVAQIQELDWEDNTFMADVPAAQITALSAPLQSHIRQLLGGEIQTVGYWFGSLSLPGEATAPLGAWKLSLEIETVLNDELQLGISVTEESQEGDSLQIMEILSNHIQAKIGKPIIIGYNRDRYGSRTMGALVIVAEEDTTPVSPLSLNSQTH